ncbi:hypothetical protein GCM10022419_132430 [Nonomuraea rosea]|uniref:ATP/GTP-binding protein n=1 Tax=Nonomuraea rosea TaxID=638574 RepID=A0ABP7A3Q2_9ACTN
MHATLTLSSLLSLLAVAHGPSTEDNGATRMGGNWVTYGLYEQAESGSPSGGIRRGARFGDCRGIGGRGSISYVQCDTGPDGKENVFNAVRPGEPGAPPVTPEMLKDQALRLLTPSAPKIVTAPPQGRNGYVGLRQYFWAASEQWHSISKRVTAGPVWAEVTATPTKLTVRPGAGQSTLTCLGPGVPYDPAKSPDDQNIDCTHVFTESSAGLPGSKYQVKASMVWSASWTGSGGAGGALAPITTTATFPLRIGEAPALVGRNS